MPNLNFVGKDKVVNHHQQISFRFLEKVYGESENMIIHGDNLLALKSLCAEYRNRIKCIYIDPPYNTGNENWIYNDNVNDPQIKSWIGKVVGDEETDLNRHDKWLCMMYPRLRLLHELLSDDGAIFISIDDNEVASLKFICQEIFGSRNFLAQIIWERAYAPVNLKKHFSTSHDYILCYAKDISKAKCNGIPRSDKTDSMYGNPDNDPRGLWRSDNLSVGPAVEKNIYEITGPTGKKFLPPSGRCWRVSREKYEELLADNRIWFGADGNNVPSFKRFLSDVKQGVTPMTIWKYTEVGHSQDATKQLKDLFDGKAVFQYPKSVELIKRCIQLYSDPDSIILDAFAGSGTTAQSVIELNREDNGNRKFILIESMEYCESITAERVRRVDGDFSFYELGDPIFIDDQLNPNISRDLLRRYLFYSETKKEIPNSEGSLLGIENGISYHLIDGILDFKTLMKIQNGSNSYVIFAEACSISQKTLDQFKTIFRKIPRDILRL